MMLPLIRAPIVLRRLRPSDLADFQAYRTDPELGLYQGWSRMTDEEARVFLEDVESAPLLQPEQWTQIAIASLGADRLMGDIGILVNKEQTQLEIGFTLAQAHQRKGVATLAVKEMIEFLLANTSVQRIVGITDARNAPSIRLLERVGMSLTQTAEAIFRGEACVEHTYSLAQRSRDDVFSR